MRVHALSALSLVGLATTAAANQLDRRQQATGEGSLACVSSIMALAEAIPTFPAAFETATDDCVPATLTEAASSYTSDAKSWYTNIANAISDCPAWPSESTIPSLPTLPDLAVAACTGEQPSSAATATMSSALGNAVATSTSPTTPGMHSSSTAASGTQSAATTLARSSATSGSASRSTTTSSSQSANAAARETGVIFAAVAMAAFGAAAL